MNKNIMVDCETLGTLADSVIMSIGAVKFDLVKGEFIGTKFYTSISVESNIDAGRSINEDTLIWWLQQSKEAQVVFTEPKVPLDVALAELSDWVGPDWGDARVWSNGADFDIPMLAHAFHSFKWSAPWKFYNTRCYRTIKSLDPAKQLAAPAKNNLAHHAAEDAIAQASHLIAIYQTCPQIFKTMEQE